MANFSWPIPQTTLTASGYSVNLNVDRELYLTIANLGSTYGGEDVTISASWQDSSGAGQTATVIAGSSFGPSLITVRTFSVSGSGALIIGTLSSSKVSPESLLASAVNVSGTVKTDVGQGTQASNNTTLNFGGTPIDPRDRTWTLGASDAPNRGWTLGSTDVPGRGWTLGSSDVPGRGWTLGSGDQPDITANQSKALGTPTLPVYIRTLGASDLPDVSQNQASTINTAPTYSHGSVHYAAPISAANQTISLTITIPPGAALELREFLVNLGSSLNIFANLSLASDQRNPDFVWGWASSQYVTLSAYSSLNLTTPRFQCVVANDQNATLSGNLGAASYIQSVHYGVHRSIINTTSSNITWTYTFTSQIAASYNVYWDVEYVGSNGITFSFSSTNAGSGGSSPPPPPACWTADTLIATPDGPKPFSDLKVGDLVLTPFGPKPILEIIHNKTVETVYRVRPRVWVTGDQRIFDPTFTKTWTTLQTWTPLQLIRGGKKLKTKFSDTWDCVVESSWVRAYGGDQGDVYLYDKTA